MTAFDGGKIVGPGEGALLLNDRWWLSVRPNDTPGGLAIIEAVLPPGARATRIHRHYETDEIWYILDGQLTFRIGTQQLHSVGRRPEGGNRDRAQHSDVSISYDVTSPRGGYCRTPFIGVRVSVSMTV